MPQALWLLMKLRLRGWARRIARNVQTVKGAVMTAFFALMMLFWLGGMCVNAFITPARGAGIQPEYVERFGPLLLLAYCVGMVSFGGGQSPFNFSLPEVQFLFSAPFSRRQLLTYKLISQLLMSMPAAVIFSFFGRSFSGSLLTGFVATVLTLIFLQFFAIALAIISSTLEEWTFTRVRRVAVFLILTLIAAAAVAGWRARASDDLVETLLRIEQSDVLQYGLMPLRWFIRTMTSTRLDARFALNAAGAVGVNLVLLALIYGLDGRYTEAAATKAEAIYSRLEKLRSGGLANFSIGPAKKVRYRTPDPLYLGGIGPIAWRQFIAAIRSRRVLGILLFVTIISSIGPLIAALTGKRGSMDDALPWTLAGMGLMMSIMMSQTLAFDFRSDVDRMEILKTLPIPAWRIVIGQLLAPVIMMSMYQIVLTGLIYLVLGRVGVLFAVTLLVSWPINLLLTGIDNVLFLLFPTRMGNANPGDFSNAGRQMLVMIGKMMGVAIGIGIPAAFGGITYALTQNWPAAILAVFLPALVTCALPIPLVTLAFQRYDVARDTPP